MYKLLTTTLLLAAALPAHTQVADKDLDGHRYCYNDKGAQLRENAKGNVDAFLSVTYKSDIEATVYAPGTPKLFGPHPELYSALTIGYAFEIGPDGNPLARPSPHNISVGTGRFASARLEPLESLEMRLQGGKTVSDPVAINSGIYSIAVLSGQIGRIGSSTANDTELAQDRFDTLVMALEQGPRWILLFQHGKEVARIPVPMRDITAERDANVAWLRKTLPLLKQGKCG